MEGMGFEPMSCIHGFILYSTYQRSFNVDLIIAFFYSILFLVVKIICRLYLKSNINW